MAAENKKKRTNDLNKSLSPNAKLEQAAYVCKGVNNRGLKIRDNTKRLARIINTFILEQ